MTQPFKTPQAAALALLQQHPACPLNWKTGSFLGNVVVADRPISAAQVAWLGQLLERAGLPPLAGDAA